MREMLRMIIAALLAATSAATSASAETPVERGAYLVNAVMACAACHQARGPEGAAKPLAGGTRAVETEAYVVHPGNLTPDAQTGLGAWSDAEIRRAIAEGIGRDGRRLAPEMPSAFYAALPAADLDAVVAYLRSLAPVVNATPAPVLRATPTAEPWPLPDPADHGAVVAAAAYCMSCHGRDAADRLRPEAQGLGGHVLRGPWGAVATPPLAGGALADWTDAELDRALTEGVDRDGEAFIPPMNRARFYGRMTAQDRAALIGWLRRL